MKLTHMRSKARWSAAAMTFKTFLISLILSVAATANAQTLDKPTFKVGDHWKWTIVDSLTKRPEGTIDIVVAKIGDTVEFSAPGSTDIVETWDLDGRMLTRGSEKRAYDSPIPWPLQKGKKYSTAISWKNSQGHEGRTSSKIELVGFEEVVVPAGKFMAAKLVTSDTSYSASLGYSLRERYVWWRAVDTGVFVRWTFEADTACGSPLYSTIAELVEHSSAR